MMTDHINQLPSAAPFVGTDRLHELICQVLAAETQKHDRCVINTNELRWLLEQQKILSVPEKK